jgi:diacylglycerol kinase family enzyme
MMRARVAAVTALVLFAAVLVVSVVFLFRNAGMLLLGLVGLMLVALGGWWVVTGTRTRRIVGGVAAVLGGVVMGVAIARVVHDVDRLVLRLVVLVVLLALAFVAARAALRHDIAHAAAVHGRVVSPPRHAVLLCNPWSGGGKVERFGLVERAAELGVETVLLDHGLDLEQLARDAVARGADCLGMAGGDGSQALVASIAVEHDLPFVCVSAGTRNHFALDLGLDREDPRRSMDAFRDAVERRVDYATVGDRFFVNNVSLGVYASIVQEDEYRDAKVETARTKLPEILGGQSEPFDLQFTTPAGDHVDGAILIMVSNNPYVMGFSPDTAQRRRLDAGELGVFAVTTQTGADAARLIAGTALGRRTRSQFWHEFTTPEFEIRSRSGVVAAGVDGEALQLGTPLRFRIHPSGLRLLVPADNLDEAHRRAARDIHVNHLVAIATGRERTVDREDAKT